MGREVGRILEELGEGTNTIRIHFIKIIFLIKRKAENMGEGNKRLDFIYVSYIDSGHISYFGYSIFPFACHSGL